MIQLHLTSAKGRSEYDKMYYKIAYELQVKEVLPDGCSSVLYELVPTRAPEVHQHAYRTSRVRTKRSAGVVL